MNQIQLERVEFEPGKSFKLFSPRLRNTFLWHYHPEVELVYVEADAGIRHVGTHVSSYTQSDLVFIGPNLPHLNFDYRLRSDYHQIVVQLRTNFMGDAIKYAPELQLVNKLFKNAAYGIAFHGDTRALVAQKLKAIGNLSNFDQLLELLNIFRILADSKEYTLLNNDESSTDFILKDKIRMGAIYEYIDAHYAKKPDVNVVAGKVNLTTSAFCRYFKRQTHITFTDFVNQYRIERAKNLLMQDKNITETCYAVGFESLSYFNKLFNKLVGQNPSAFKKRWVSGSAPAKS
ncbi:AraC family transcriptional regulator [Mucilaginibacter sp. SG564]|uniref:AraC family transcriptional regulator n=1 Tax=Mucilaginibacter sp. SG564 TaxID=2587022 RepID=UPI0015578113|nr:AraC family transcriptional regulator [Mucilaginibacter sp. SG564]NOW97470.1 AraC-like DNA-binding protein [Mucilaginibacter sp. SG564]